MMHCAEVQLKTSAESRFVNVLSCQPHGVALQELLCFSIKAII
jgi:hypothetical protein